MPNAEMTRVSDLTVIKTSNGSKGQPAIYLVFNGFADPVGMLTRYPSSRTTRHPWKAYVNVGKDIQYIASFYEDKERGSFADPSGANFGGRKAALASIASSL